MADDDVALGVVQRVALRKIAQNAYQGADNKRQVGQRRGTFPELAVEMATQRFELGDVDFLDVGEMWNVALRLAHALSDDAADSDDFDFLGFRLVGYQLRPRPHQFRAGATGNKRFEILAQDAAVWARSGELSQIDACLMGAAADGGRSGDATGGAGMAVRSAVGGPHATATRARSRARRGRHATGSRGRARRHRNGTSARSGVASDRLRRRGLARCRARLS